MRWRTVLLEQEEPGYWLTHPLPELDGIPTFLFRIFSQQRRPCDLARDLASRPLFAQLFQRGSSIDQVCDLLETQSEAIQEEVATNLPGLDARMGR